MVNRLKFEAVIVVCMLLIGWVCETLVVAKTLSILALCGYVLLLSFLLYVAGIFSFVSVDGVGNDKRSRKNAFSFYGYLAIIAIVSLLILIVLEVGNIICWVTACMLWCLSCIIRHVMFWDLFWKECEIKFFGIFRRIF